MQQTLLALVAVLVFSLFTLSRHEFRADGPALGPEVERAGARIARERLADVLSHRFDEADLARGRVRTTPRGLSRLGPDGEAAERDYDDVDDFHGATRVLEADGAGGPVTFTDSVAVRYLAHVAGELRGVPGPTLMKQVTVVVRARPAGFVGTAPVAARLRQIATPAP